MSEITGINEGQVRVDATAVLANGTTYKTAVTYQSVSELRSQNSTERRDTATAQIIQELAQQQVTNEALVAECIDLMDQLWSGLALDGTELEQAQAHEFWAILLSRGEPAIRAGLQLIQSQTGSDQEREVWLAFLAQAAMVDVPSADGSVTSRVLAWQVWAAENGISP